MYRGTAEVLTEGCGKLLRSLIEAGASLGISSSGFGTCVTEADGTSVVQPDYQLRSLDCVCEPANHNDTTITQILESTAAERSVMGPTGQAVINDLIADFISRYPEIARAQAAHVVNFDKKYGRYQDPNSSETFLQTMERDRAEILQKLLDLQTAVKGYKFYDDANAPERFTSYARAIAKYGGSDPIKTASLKRENQRIAYTNSVIRETVNLLSRVGKRLHESPEDFNVATNLRRRAQRDDEANTTFNDAAKALNKNGYDKDKSPTAMDIHPSSVFTHPQRDDIYMHRADTNHWEHHDENPLHSFSTNVSLVV